MCTLGEMPTVKGVYAISYNSVIIHVHTWHNVFMHNVHVLVSVRPRVFVPEAYHMTQLVHHNAELITVFTNGDGLSTIATLAHK